MRGKQLDGTIKEITLRNGDKRYRLVIEIGRDGARKQHCSTHVTRDEAKAKRDEIRVARRKGAVIERSTITVGDFLDKWVDTRHGVREGTRYGYRGNLKPVVDKYGTVALQKLTPSMLRTLVTERLTTGGRSGEGAATGTVRLMLMVLGTALDAAVKERLLDVNPVRLIDKPKAVRRGPDEPWTAEQVATFLDHVADSRYAAGWRLSLLGMRRGEVLALTWDNVDLDQARVTVAASRRDIGGKVVTGPTKNGKTRIVPIGPEVVADLRVLKKLQAVEALANGRRNAAGYVFVNENGVTLRPEFYSHLFASLCHDAGVPRIRLHSLRHTAASLMAAAGVPIIDAAALLGHDPIIYSSTYAHVYDDGVSKAADTLAEMYRTKRSTRRNA